MGCYDGIWKCRNRLPTIGKETIFEYSAWQPMRVQKSTIFKNICYFHWWEHDFLDMQNSDFQKSCISMGGRAISEIAKPAIFTIWLLSSGGKATSEMCKTVIFENHCISIGGRAISEIAKTAIFTNWLLSNGGKAISEMCKTMIFKNQCIVNASRIPPRPKRRLAAGRLETTKPAFGRYGGLGAMQVAC